MNGESPLRILLVEDDEKDALWLREMLNASEGMDFTLIVATCLKDARAELAAKAFDIILSDLALSDGNGLDTVKALRAVAPVTPMVVLTGLQDQAVAIAAIRAGAQDYLVKDRTSCDLLARTLRYALERARLQESLRAALEEKQNPRATPRVS